MTKSLFLLAKLISLLYNIIEYNKIRQEAKGIKIYNEGI